MCGIAGIYAYLDVAPKVDRAELARMNVRMAPRGPDGSGDWYSNDERVGFTHRRLAIIELSDLGAQPMHSEDGSLTITFNGEIYNYPELRAELVAKGYRFRSHSDTEVLLQLYRDRGPAMVEALRGMFAFGLWDAQQRRLVLARDPLGIRPLYYADDGWTVRFASTAKALLAGGSGIARPRSGRHRGLSSLRLCARAIYGVAGHSRRASGLRPDGRCLGTARTAAVLRRRLGACATYGRDTAKSRRCPRAVERGGA